MILTTTQESKDTVDVNNQSAVVAPLTDHSGLGFHFNVDYRHSGQDIEKHDDYYDNKHSLTLENYFYINI